MTEELNADMSTEGTHAFFHDRDPLLEAAIVGMESVETWTQDKTQSVQDTLQKLSDRVEDIDVDDITGNIQSKLIILLGYISSGKAIKLLMWIDLNSPNFVAKTLAEAQMLSALDKINEGAARLFVERFEVLERMHMLSRVFSEERLQIVQKVLRILSGEDNESLSEDEGNEEHDEPQAA